MVLGGTGKICRKSKEDVFRSLFAGKGELGNDGIWKATLLYLGISKGAEALFSTNEKRCDCQAYYFVT